MSLSPASVSLRYGIVACTCTLAAEATACESCSSRRWLLGCRAPDILTVQALQVAGQRFRLKSALAVSATDAWYSVHRCPVAPGAELPVCRSVRPS